MIFERLFVNQKVFSVLWISLVIKCCLAVAIPLAADENYYWVWSQNLQLSYFDHPAMIAWLLKLGEPFANFASAVRIPGVFLGQLTLLIWVQILRPLISADKIVWWLVLVLLSPLLGFGSLVMTPDVPLLFFWSLSLLLFARLLEKKGNLDITSSCLGLSLGLGFCSKYHIVLFPIVVVLYLLLERKWRELSLKSLFLVFIFGLIGSLPVLIWNYGNDFSSFKFQLNHGLGRNIWNPFWTYSYPIGQIFLIFPVPFYFAFRAWPSQKNRLIYFFAATPLLFFFLSSFRGVVEMNWPIVAYPSVYALAVFAMPSTRGLKFTVGIWLLLLGVVLSNMVFPWIKNPPDKLRELSYFKPTIEARLKYSPIFAESYQMASYLWFQTKNPTYKLYQMSRRDYYDELPQAKPLAYPFYIIMDRNASYPLWLIEAPVQIETVEELSDIFVVRRVSLK